MRRLVIIGLLCSVAAFGAGDRVWSVGVIGGVPFNDVGTAQINVTGSFVSFTAPSDSPRYTVGPALRINLPARFRLEADALYRPYSWFEFVGFNSSVANVHSVVYSVANVNISAQWRFPVVLQYRLPSRHRFTPFVGAGPSFQHLSGSSTGGTLEHLNSTGVVAGGGADLKIPHLRLSAELRYTHVAAGNSGELLVGVHF